MFGLICFINKLALFFVAWGGCRVVLRERIDRCPDERGRDYKGQGRYAREVRGEGEERRCGQESSPIAARARGA